jgi:hypothetical protein
MIMKGKALILAAAITALSAPGARGALPEEVHMGGLWYEIDHTVREAKVSRFAKEGNIDTSLSVPSQFIFDGEVYTVTEIMDGAFEVKSGDKRTIRIGKISTEGKLQRIGKKAFAGVELGEFYTGEGNGPMKVDSGAFSGLAGNVSSITFGKGTQTIGKDALSGSLIEKVSLPSGLSNLHIEAMRGDGVRYVKHLYLNWATPYTIPEKLIDNTGSSVGGTLTGKELLGAFIRSVCGFIDGVRHWESKIHIPKTLVSETSYRSDLFWKGLFAEGDILYNNLYSVTVKTDPSFSTPQVSPWGKGEYPYGEEIKLEALKPNGYFLLNWESGGEELSTASVYKYKVQGEAEVTAHFMSDTLSKDGISYVPVQGTWEAIVGRNGGYKANAVLTIASTVTDGYSQRTYTVSEIGASAFENNGVIDSVYIPNGVKSIKDNAFKNCKNLHAVVLPVTLETMSATAFESTTAKMLDVYVLWEDVTRTQKVLGVWLARQSYVRLHVPKGSYKNYDAAFGSKVVTEELLIWASANVSGYGKVEIKGEKDGGTFPYGVVWSGDSVRLKAVASAGYVFDRWTTKRGDYLSDKAEYTFFAESDKELVAVFVPVSCVVYVSVGGGGGGTISSGQSGVYRYGETLTLEAKADRGHTFVHWLVSDPSVDGGASRKVTTAKFTQTVQGDTIEIIAVFKASVRLSVMSLSVDKGTLVATLQLQEVRGTTSIDTECAYGIPVTLWVEGKPEGYYVSWVTEKGFVLSTENPYTFTLTEDTEVFVRISNVCKVTSEVQSGGEIKVYGRTLTESGFCNYGDTIRVEVKASAGYLTGDLNVTNSKGGVEKQSVDSVVVVKDDIRLSVDFYAEKYAVTCLYDRVGGQVSGVDNSQLYGYGEILHLVAIPESGYRFAGWKNSYSLLSSQHTYDIVVIGDVSLTADFVDMGLWVETPAMSVFSPRVSYVSGVLEATGCGGSQVEIVSVWGETVGRFAITADRESKYLSLAAGIYVVKITKGGESKVTKVVAGTK